MAITKSALDFSTDGEGPTQRFALIEAAFLGASACAALLLGAAPPLTAAEPVSPLAQGLFGEQVRDHAQGAQRFATPDGLTRFTLDRASPVALMRFEGSGEVLALKPTPGPHGDEFLKDDIGRVVVRVTAPGGLIVYANAEGLGAPATAEGHAARLAGPSAPAGGLAAKLAEIERTTARRVGHPVTFDAPPGASLTNSSAIGLVADAAERAAEGVAAVRGTPVTRVQIAFGPSASVRLAQESLRVTIAPQLGYAGRPSADAIEAVLRAPKR